MKTNYYLATLFLVAGGVGVGTYVVPQGGELAMIYYRSGRLDQARGLLEREMHRGDLAASNVYYATQTYIRLGDIERAIALVERYVAAEPKDVRARRILGDFYRDTGRQALYIGNLEEIERLAPAAPQRVELAWLYRAIGEYEKWAAMLERLVAENTANPDDYFHLAQVLAASGRRDAAFAVLQKLEDRHPRQVTLMAYELRISMELDDARPGKALEWARKGVARIPGEGTALAIVSLLQRRDRNAMALEVLEPFGNLATTNMGLMRTLVILEMNEGKAARALERLQALERTGKLAGSDRNLLILAALAAGNWDAAKAAFEGMEFADIAQDALDRMASEAVARADRAGIRLILSRASSEFLTQYPVTAAELNLILEDRAGAERWAGEAFKRADISNKERIALATVYIKLENRDRARALLKSLTADGAVLADVALELAAVYLKLDLAAEGFALFDGAAKTDSAPRLKAARTVLGAKLKPDLRAWDLSWMEPDAEASGIRADLATNAYWTAMDAQLYALAAAIGRRVFEGAATNDTRLRYARALAYAGDAQAAIQIVRPMLDESADARSVYSVALIAAVKAGTAKEDEAKAFIAQQLDDPKLSMAEKKGIVAALIEAKAFGIVLPLLEDRMKRGEREYVEPYMWALSAVKDKKQLKALLQQELGRADERSKLLALATVAFQESFFDVARPAYLRILKEDPKNHDALKRLGQIAYWGSDTGSARRYLEQFMAAGGDDYRIDYTLGEVIISFPDWERATPYYQRAMAKIAKLEKPTLEDRMMRAKLLYRLGRFDDSAAAYEALLRQFPRDRALRDEFYDVLNEMGRYDRARQLRGGRAER